MSRAPSIVPEDLGRDIYLVFDNFGGALGRAWRETQEGRTDRAVVVRDLLEGQYSSPVRVIAFNLAEGWSRDVTHDIADELALLCAQLDMIPEAIVDFVAEHMIQRKDALLEATTPDDTTITSGFHESSQGSCDK